MAGLGEVYAHAHPYLFGVVAPAGIVITILYAEY